MKQFRRDKIRMYAFLTSCLIALILLCGVGVFAAEFTAIKTKFGFTKDDFFTKESYQSSDFYDSNAHINFKPTGTNSDAFNFAGNTNNTLPIPSSYTGTESDYFFVYSGGGNLYYGYFTENTIINSYDDIEIWIPQDELSQVNSVVKNEWDYLTLKSMNNNQGSSFFAVIDGVTYYKAFNEGNNQSWLIYGNLPIYSVSDFSAVTSFNDLNQSNYGSAYGDAFPDVTGESELNNLYFPSSDFKWRVDQYGLVYDWPSGSGRDFADQALSNADHNMLKKSNWGSGAVDFTAVLSDYQKEHPDEFKIKFKFMCWMKYFLPSANTAIEGSSWTGYYIFATNPYEVDVPLSTFIVNGNIKTFTMSDIFSNLNITSTNTQFNTTIQGAYRQLYEEEYLLWDNSTELGWKLQATAQLYPTDNNLIESSGYNTETYNLLTQISKQTEDSLSDNEYPYAPDDETNENTPDLGGGNNSQSVSSGNGQIIVTNNDNDTININDGNAETVEDLYNDLTSSDGEDSLSERFVNLVNENAWITIMQETFSFIPSSIWVSLEIFVVTALGILAASFVLRIILDLL